MILKRILLLIALVLSLLIIILVINTINFKSKQLQNVTTIPPASLSDLSIQHLQHAVRFKTISYDDAKKYDTTEFQNFANYLSNAYPKVHKTLKREIINDLSLLYIWKGKDESKQPIVLMAHYDVVPVEEQTIDQWDVDPFSGALKNGFIWGRGSVDNKMNLVSMLEAAERLIENGHTPERTIYFVFGHDEEIGGMNGAKAIADLLQKRNVKPELVLDEGGFITTTKIPDFTLPVALLGTSEKGFLTIELGVNKNGGHSSMPEPETAIDILAKALYKTRNNPMPGRISESQRDFIETIGPEMPFVKRMVFANSWLFGDLIIHLYSKTSAGNALNHTTIVPTILSSGLKDNVIPSAASAIVNIRLLPDDSIEDITQSIKKIINDDRVNITTIKSSQLGGYTSQESYAYRTINKVIKKTFPRTVTTPFLLIGGTDSRYFTKLTNNVIKFSPMLDPLGFHGINERISVESYQLAISFYSHLIKAV
jgi:carboxypeptidase PM20D1